MRYIFAPEAYARLLAHGLRYSSYEVNGVLLGSRNLEQDDVVRVDQAVPLFHSPTLKPMLDAAMMLVEQHVREAARGLAVVGYYVAKDTNAINSPSALDKQIATQLQDRFPAACLLLIDPAKAHPSNQVLALKAFTIGTLARDSSAVLELSDQQSAAPFFGKLGERLSAGVSDADGCDFEAHLERPELDWLGLRRAAA